MIEIEKDRDVLEKNDEEMKQKKVIKKQILGVFICFPIQRSIISNSLDRYFLCVFFLCDRKESKTISF